MENVSLGECIKENNFPNVEQWWTNAKISSGHPLSPSCRPTTSESSVMATQSFFLSFFCFDMGFQMVRHCFWNVSYNWTLCSFLLPLFQLWSLSSVADTIAILPFSSFCSALHYHHRYLSKSLIESFHFVPQNSE